MTLIHDDDCYQTVRRAFDAPWSGPRGPQVLLRDGDLTATIYPHDGCRMTSLTAFGLELLRQWTPDRRAFQYGCFPMVPWVGRLGSGRLQFGERSWQLPVNKPPHALHGMACFAPWRIGATSASSAEFHFDLGDPWPWQGSVTQRYELAGNTLTIALKISTAGDSFPAAAGWHPWFRKGLSETATDAEKLHIGFTADWQYAPGSDELPSSERIAPRPGPWDDCFGFDGPMRAELLWPGQVRLDMTSPASSMVVYDKQPDAACVEPLSGPPNGVNTAPQLVSTASDLVTITQWAISRAV
ncbi:aldose epimerase [Rhodopseudomonas palustris]|uniref:Aldose 1-epimerase n=1 Tax=Rhodopseudomonas palustris (strain BisB18) TaxID=316056 RepID=Q21AH4_RHOPB